MQLTVRTLYGMYLQNVAHNGVPLTEIEFSTLNERLEILPKVPVPNLTYPKLGYFVIGNKGHDVHVGANGVALPTPRQKTALDASLYGLRPFIIRDINNDLPPHQRALYCLRKEENYNGKRYIAYYGRRLDTAAATTELVLLTALEDGSTKIEPISEVLSRSNLFPQPQVLTPVGVNTLKGKYVRTMTHYRINFDEEQVQELINVANIIEDDPREAIISEIGLVAGVDKTIRLDDNTHYDEVLRATVCHHAAVFKSAMFDDAGFHFNIATGASDPLWNIGEENIENRAQYGTP